MRAYWTGEGKEPRLAHEGDAGFDLSYNGVSVLTVHPDETINVPTGIYVQLPYGTWGMITGRSSTFKNNLLTPLSVIDNGFRGELFAIVRNIGKETAYIYPSDRVAQLIPIPMLADVFEWVHVDQLDDSERGDQGFGSTGR